MKGVSSKRAFAALVIGPLLGAASACSSSESIEPPAPTTEATVGFPSGPQPDYGPLVGAAEPPPPISGGTLAIDTAGANAIAADPDRDRVFIVHIPTRELRATIELPARSEPGRVAVDGAGHAFVALRRGGQLAVVDIAKGAVSLHPACSAPRGVAYDPTEKSVYLACAGGEFVTFDPNGVEIGRKRLERDLRDVVLADSRVLVTHFRSAEIGVVDGTEERAWKRPPGVNLAWRALAADPADPDAGTVVVGQEPTEGGVSTKPGGYGGGGGACTDKSTAILSTRVDHLGLGSVRLPSAVLPVDLATNGREYVVVAAGNAFTKELPQLYTIHADAMKTGNPCPTIIEGNVPGQAVAAAFDGLDQLIVQTREPAAIHIVSDDRQRVWKTITLSDTSRADTGHAIFHANAGGFIACASCHAEGGDDGHTWNFLEIGPRRTPSLLGTTAHTEPFHWDGDMADIKSLVDHVFVGRMSGPRVDEAQVEALGRFMFTLPAPNKLRAEAEVPDRGRALFAQRCASCHSGPQLTNNQSIDVGTGGKFQVPSLVGVAWRAPFLHSGCATTLRDRFSAECGGAVHGNTNDLDPASITDLVAYLESL